MALDLNPLHLVKAEFLSPTVIELRCMRGGMVRHRMLQRRPFAQAIGWCCARLFHTVVPLVYIENLVPVLAEVIAFLMRD